MKNVAILLAFVLGLTLPTGICQATNSNSAQQPSSQNNPDRDSRKGAPAKAILSEKPIRDAGLEAQYQKAAEPARQAFRAAQGLYRSGDLIGAERAAMDTIRLGAGLSPIHGSEARLLIAHIRIRQERYQEALQWLESDWQKGKDTQRDLDIALCFVRLGNVEMAKRLYSEQTILHLVSAERRADFQRSLPGTQSRRTLEASILFVRGNEFAMRGHDAEALSAFQAASKLVPTNGLIAYSAGMTLTALRRRAEAIPYFRIAAEHGIGETAIKARVKLGSMR